jgi:hypothetical protein
LSTAHLQDESADEHDKVERVKGVAEECLGAEDVYEHEGLRDEQEEDAHAHPVQHFLPCKQENDGIRNQVLTAMAVEW